MLLKNKLNLALLMGVFMLAACQDKGAEVNTASVQKVEDLIAQTKEKLKFPAQMTPDIRWDNLNYDPQKNTVFYTYTLSEVNAGVTDASAQQGVEEQMQAKSDQVCSDLLTKAMLEGNILMGYTYFGPDGKQVGSFTIDLKKICK